MMDFKLYFVTSNLHKFNECKDILQMPIQQIKLDLDEIQDVDLSRVVKHKTLQAYDQQQRKIKSQGQNRKVFIITEDTGLYIDGLKGLPGALIKWFLSRLGNQGICDIIKGSSSLERSALAETRVGFFDGQNYKSFSGKIKGIIPLKPRGKSNFGWDPIFIPQGGQKTFAEMSKAEKNRISMRKKALNKLKNFLEGLSVPDFQ